MQRQLQVHFRLRRGHFKRRNLAHRAVWRRSPARPSVVRRHVVTIGQVNDGKLFPANPAENLERQISAANVDRSLFLSCANFLQGCYSSDRLDVLRDDLLGGGSIGCRGVLSKGTLNSGSGAALSNYGYGYRM